MFKIIVIKIDVLTHNKATSATTVILTHLNNRIMAACFIARTITKKKKEKKRTKRCTPTNLKVCDATVYITGLLGTQTSTTGFREVVHIIM